MNDKKINVGVINGDVFIKHVSFSRAVLWKTKEISLPQRVIHNLNKNEVKTVVFIDVKSKERWSASMETLKRRNTFKKEGQEPQFYFPISVFDVEKY